MKTIQSLLAAGAIVTVLTGQVLATEFTKGKVKKVDADAGKVTVIHEELKNLDMPAMTMVFRTGDDAMMERLQEGQEIEFVAERVNGKLTITELK
ncbi:copper-binding protein [Mesorhizobium sp. Z1-4]|uniref:copper-binding protein n=1 Tax=Mesorhizobium sp. Z1-4 TaxID=2448478 RepID=UPI000FDC61F7|nr:copper-binding protein [Mesorhizobium sp. Z1-4]